MTSVTQIEPFALKEFFYSPDAGRARVNLSQSFAEPLTVGELLALEEGAADGLAAAGLGYPGLGGSAFLRRTIAGLYRGLDADDVIVMSGLDEAIAMLALANLEKGDRIIVHTPCYQTYTSVPAWRGAEVVAWAGRRENEWAPDLGELETLLERPARWVIANFPHNPTGFVPDAAYLANLVAMAERHGTVLLCDEIYSGLSIEGRTLPPVAELSETAVSMNSVSKRLGAPGLRIGWLASRNRALLVKLAALRNHFNSYATAPGEYLADLALRHADEIVNRNHRILVQNAGIAEEFFTRHAALFRWRPPSAGVNAFPEWRGGGGTQKLSERLLGEAGVLVAPSAMFGAGDAHMRIGLGCRDFASGMERLGDFLERGA